MKYAVLVLALLFVSALAWGQGASNRSGINVKKGPCDAPLAINKSKCQFPIGGGAAAVGPPAAGAARGAAPGPTESFNDQFEADVTGWSARSGMTSCTQVTCFDAISGCMDPSNTQGICIYDGAQVEGTQPSTRDHWGIFELDEVANNNGLGLRAKTTAPGATDFSYAVRCGTGDFVFRICESDDTCSTFETSVGGCATNFDDVAAAMVAGETASTELCAFHWAAADSKPSDFGDPGTWGDADYCTSASGTMVLLSDYVGGGTTESAWTSSPGTLKGFPALAQRNVTSYWGAATTGRIKFFRAGDLGL